MEEIDFKQFATRVKKFLRELVKYKAGTKFVHIKGARGFGNGLCYLIAQTAFPRGSDDEPDSPESRVYSFVYPVVSHFINKYEFDTSDGYLPNQGVLTQERKDLCEIMLKGLTTKLAKQIYEKGE